ncbi:uncharacterized protein LOC112455897 [Temnothorax curvispinosus]|uniref:Uncharacterized protein LOC112455897 n=1 Tax=Temnothorax curvispinosus TaxID=300111 RepID=A0A6J1PWZ7_9HYME|nr:uncharacterized protein LOC112455897 [Temnothorax curvispinosus]
MACVTHAKIKFLNAYDKADVIIVKIEEILEFTKKPPEHVQDFNKECIYNCLWKDDKNPDIVKVPVQISDLAVITNAEDMEKFKNKKGVFKRISNTILDDYYAEDSEIEDDKDVHSEEDVEINKNIQKEGKTNQKAVSLYFIYIWYMDTIILQEKNVIKN